MLAEPECSKRRCKHFIGVSSHVDELEQVCICIAFPKGIPNEIAYGDNPHTAPYLGDNGIQFEQE